MSGKLIYFEWNDAFASAGWHSKDDLKELAESDFYIKEAGWLIEETPKYVIIGQSWTEEDGFKSEKFSNIHKIPKTWIRKRKVLKYE